MQNRHPLSKRSSTFIFVPVLLLIAIAPFFITRVTQAAASKPATGSTNHSWSVVSSANASINDSLYGMAAVTTSDVWAVGFYQDAKNTTKVKTLVENWNGTSWSIVPSPNVGGINQLYGAAAISANDVWAVGHESRKGLDQTLIENWNGTSWSIVPSPNVGRKNQLYGVAAVSMDDVWAVGNAKNAKGVFQALIENWNGTSWSIIPSPNAGIGDYLTGVTAISADDTWAVGYYQDAATRHYLSLIEHWNGTSWSIVTSPNGPSYSTELKGVAAAYSKDVWAVGYYQNSVGVNQTLAEHWNGTSWRIVPLPDAGQNGFNALDGIAAISVSDVWAVGFYSSSYYGYQTLTEHWNGTNWSIVSSPEAKNEFNMLEGVAAISAHDIWTAGFFGGGGPYIYNYQTLIDHYQ